MNKTSRSLFPLSMLLGIALLPSCKPLDWIKSKFGGSRTSHSSQAGSGDVLLTIEGEPALTSEEFEKYYDQILEQQPQLRQFAAMMPDLKENIYTTLVSQKILEYWAKKNGITERPEYKLDREALVENVDRGLAIKYFQAEHPVMISDAEIEKFYQENKDTLYVMAQGGANAVGASFDTQAGAKAFLDKAKQPKADVAKLAGEEKVTFRNFGRVHDQSAHVEEALRKKILGMKDGAVDMFPVDKKYWVVQVTSKDEPKYYPLEQAKEDVRSRLQNDRMVEMFNAELSKLKDQYNVVEHKDYLESSKDNSMNAELPQEVADNEDNSSVQPAKAV